MQQLLQHGAGVRLVVNGVIIGFATGLTFTRSTSSKFIYGIDSPYAVEIAKTAYSVQGTLTGLRIRDSGGLDGVGIMDESNASAYFNSKYCVMEIVDRATNKNMFTIQKVIFDQDSWSIQAKQLVSFSANFKGIFVSNEVTDEPQ